MKENKVIYLNEQHKEIVDRHLKMMQKMMYYATENTKDGKFQDYLSILDSIYTYSNNFHDTVVSKKKL